MISKHLEKMNAVISRTAGLGVLLLNSGGSKQTDYIDLHEGHDSRSSIMKTGKRFLSKFVLSGIGAAVLAGCSGGLIEAPNYKVHEVESFKVAGAPNRVMMI